MMKKIILFSQIFIYLLSVFLFVEGVKKIGSSFIYPLDDAYIHMAIAKNFALNHVWGITEFAFSSTTSSPLYTLLLSACIFIFGNNIYLPLYINIAMGVLVIIYAHQFFKNLKTFPYILSTTALIWLIPLYAITTIGMEHVLHILLMLAFILAAQKYHHTRKNIDFIYLCTITFLATSTRYESLFFSLIYCFILFFNNKKYFKTIIFGLVSLVPVIIYGLISIKNGSYFFPNSLLVKANIDIENQFGFVKRLLGNIYRSRSILLFALFLTFYLYQKYRKNKVAFSSFIDQNAIRIIILGGFILHLFLANFGWLYRYEAYLLALLIVATVPFFIELFYQAKTKKWIYVPLLVAFGIPFYLRTYDAYKHLGLASKNIFDQQIQMANFIKKYEYNSSIVANDIGAISYYSDIKLLDIIGLGSKEIIDAKKRNIKPTDFITQYSQQNHYKIALVYDFWLSPTPKNFIKVEEWTINDNYICGETVSIYAIGKENESELRRNLQKFHQEISPNVKITIK